ncbi:MAG: hypothetical protein ABI325_02905 [Ginsengibacter sp.]
MNIANTYPVFEPDQVLTNKHLNSLFDYLDQQDRLTRMKLIGSGIVCGLDITRDTSSIKISKGCGLTSQGFLITFCDKVYTHYINYATQDFPADLHIIQPCEAEEIANIPFYKENFKDGIFQLITDVQADGLNADEQATQLANATIKSDDYAVVLFLESVELALKNCDTNDCNDKGSEMDFEVKVLLVEKIKLDAFLDQQQLSVPGPKPTVPVELHHVELQRYNVPVQDLKTADDVLDAFVNLVTDAKLKTIAEVLNYCYVHYYYLLKDEPSNPFAQVFERFKKLRDGIVASAPIIIQYFYDFIDDVLKAYYEFKHKVFEVTSGCCGNEMKFPLHLMLGEASVNTSPAIVSKYRQYFIYSPLFNDQSKKLEEVRLLFARMRLLITETAFPTLTDFEKRLVKITPSRYGYVDFSDRCIPYHYNVIDNGNELYRYWSYEKTSRGNERFNLSYNAHQYCSADNVVQPLLYDIERFNFFRIEGHIGKNIFTATSLVKSLQQKNNLPFDVVALSADFIGALVKGEDPKCVIQDLESDYRMIIAEFICKLHDAFCFVARLPYTLPERILKFSSASFAEATVEDATAIKTTMAFNPAVLEKLNHPFASNLVNEFQAIKNYSKGDTLSRLCNPAANTIGAAYVNRRGQFSNPVTADTNQPVSIVQFHAFEFIDTVESVLELVMNFELADVDVNELKSRYDRFEKEVRLVSLFAISFLQTLENNDKSHLSDLASDLYLDLLIFNLEMLLHLCFVEQVEALKSEYLRRIAQYRLAKNFSYYFKTHGGIEHKAGVPTGGTFILVYHEERKGRFIDPKSLFITKELSNLALANFHDLVKSDVSLDTLIYKTKLLQTSLLYKEPELYLSTKKFLAGYLDECKDLPDDKRKELTNILNEEPKRPHFSLTDGMVIADFYIPYICCSDCPPVAYILPAVDNVVFDIQPRRFLFDDAHNYQFTTVPPVTNTGKVQKNFSSADLLNPNNLKLITDKSNILYLHPAMGIQNTLQASLTYRGIQLPITIIKPDASFTANMIIDPNNTSAISQVELVAKSEDGDAGGYQWTVSSVNGEILKTDENIFTKVASPPRVPLASMQSLVGTKDLLIELTITYTLNDNKSTDTQKVIIVNEQPGPFTSITEEE